MHTFDPLSNSTETALRGNLSHFQPHGTRTLDHPLQTAYREKALQMSMFFRPKMALVRSMSNDRYYINPHPVKGD